MSVSLDDFYSGDGIKDSYREYLENWGIIEIIHETLNKLMLTTTKPEKPLDFIREQLGGKTFSPEAMEEMDEQLDNAEREIQRLKNILYKLGWSEENDEMLRDEQVNERSELN